ncbi:MAG: hypothetical protein RLY43_1442, partial [Bacteroidota bacterium]
MNTGLINLTIMFVGLIIAFAIGDGLYKIASAISNFKMNITNNI